MKPEKTLVAIISTIWLLVDLNRAVLDSFLYFLWYSH